MYVLVTEKKCDHCNAPIEENAVFCFECGHELSFSKPNSYDNQVTDNEKHTQSFIRSGSSPTERTYAQQDIYGKQQGKNYRRKRVTSRMISRIISFAIMMAIIYVLGYFFLD